MIWEGLNGTLHDGTPGLHLFCPDCPTGCYELALPTTVSTEAKQTAVNDALEDDGMSGLCALDVATNSATFG